MKKPNILYVITDEHPTSGVSCYDSTYVETPNLDKLAEEGVKFNNAYSASPTCTPARAALMAGMYPQNTGAWSNGLGLSYNIKNIGHYFKKNGYNVAYIGKWHLDGADYFGFGECPEPFDPEYWYEARNHLEFLGEEKGALWRGYSLTSSEVAKKHNIDRDFTFGGQITNRALKFLEENKDNNLPWLLIVAYDEPHGPCTCPPEFLAKYENKDQPIPESFYKETFENKPLHQKAQAEATHFSEEQIKMYNRMSSACTDFIDDEIGKVLEANTQKDNTYTIFTSDHGNQMGSHKSMWKGPWMYDESTKTPLIVSGPNVQKGKTDETIVSGIDILPTIMELTNYPPPPVMSGASFKDNLFKDSSNHPNRAIISFNRFQVSHDSYGQFFPIRCIVKDNLKLVINLLSEIDELYDLEKDPQELKNEILSEKFAERRDELFEELIDFIFSHRDPMRTPYWEMRPWNKKEPRFHHAKGGGRCLPSNGIDKGSLGYMNGKPISYNYNK